MESLEPGQTDRGNRDVVFLSYGHSDRPWLDRLMVLLAPLVHNRRMTLWADPYLPVGEDWRRELIGAIDRANFAVLLVSADFLASRFIMEEELPALVARGVRLVPVLVQDCLWEHEPLLERVQWAHDPGRDGPLSRRDDTPAERDGRLVRICRRLMSLISDEAAGERLSSVRAPIASRAAVAELTGGTSLGGLDGVPPLPRGYVQRADLSQIRTSILKSASGAVGVTGNAAALGLYGHGGIGKTVLAAAVARDERVRAYFPDGVIWVAVGERADVVGAQVDLLRRLNCGTGEVRSATDGLRLLRQALAGLRVLLVIDDVWTDAQAAAFRAVGAHGRVLYTTRDPWVLAAVDSSVHQIEMLPDAASRELLARISGTPIDRLPVQADQVLEATGRVPLALALVAAAVRSGMSWRQLAEALSRAAGTFLDHPYANTFKAMQLATGALPQRLRDAYVSLAVYPPDAPVPLSAVKRFWAHQRGMTNDEASSALAALAEAELLRLSDDHVSFHDLQHDYVVLQAEDLAVFHMDLISAYRRLVPESGRTDWWRLPAGEPYIWDHLVHHLRMAGDRIGMLAAATDVAFVGCRIAYHGIHAAEADLDMAADSMPGQQTVDWLRRWLTRHGHLLTAVAGVGDVSAAMYCWLAESDGRVERERLRPLLPTRFFDIRWGLTPLSTASLRTLIGHTKRVHSVLFNPDGRFLATGGGDGVVRLWDSTSGEQRMQLPGHGSMVMAMALSPDGQLLAAAGSDGIVRMWNPETGEQSLELAAHTLLATALSFAPDGKLLASGGADGAVRLWDSASGLLRMELLGHSGQFLYSRSKEHFISSGGNVGLVTAVLFSPDGRLLASGDGDGLVRLWNPDNGKQQAMLPRQTWSALRRIAAVTGRRRRNGPGPGAADEMMFSPDGLLLASGGNDGVLRLWDAEAAKLQAEFPGHRGGVAAVAFSPDGRCLAGGGNDGVVRLWDIQTREQRAELPGHDGGVKALAFSPSGEALATARWDGLIRLWDPRTGRQLAELDGHTALVPGLAFSPDGRLLASVSWDETAKLWDTSTIGEYDQARRPGRLHTAAAVTFSPDGHLLATANYDGTVRLWDPETGERHLTLSEQFRTTALLTGQAHPMNAVAFSRDGRLLASGGDDGVARLWDPKTGELQKQLPERIGGVHALAFSPDGRWLAGGGTREAWLSDLAAGGQVTDLSGYQDLHVEAMAFSPDGCSLAIAVAEGMILLLDPNTGEYKGRMVHWGPRSNEYGAISVTITAIAFSPDGRLLVSGGDEGAAQLWDPQNGEQLATLNAHDEGATALAFSFDGRLLATGNNNGEMALWDVAEGALIHRLPLGRRIRSLAWSGTFVSVATDTATMLEIGVQ